MTDLRHSVAAAAITGVCALFVLGRAATAPAPPPKRLATPSERATVASTIAQNEKNWLREVGENFPDDNWSQRDDFHGKEYRKISELTSEKGIRIEDALRAVDDDVHAAKAPNANAPDTRAAHAVPCKPRPFYD
jgi:hypothetical protein